MIVAVGADHAGFALKVELVGWLKEAGHQVNDLGAFNLDPDDDYPDFAVAVARSVTSRETERGIVICGSGVGASVTANKIRGIRACLCHDTYSAAQGVAHDDMNVLCLGERVIGIALAHTIVDAFLEANFSGAPRHQRRLDKVLAIEDKYLAT